MDRHYRHPDAGVPDYGSPAWHALPEHHPHRHRALVLAAEAWRRFWSPEMLTNRQEQAEWEFRARLRGASYDIARALSGYRFIVAGSYRERAARQALRSDLRCGHPTCTTVVEVIHPFPARWLGHDGWPAASAVRCPAHDTPTTPDQTPESGVRAPRTSAVRASPANSAPHPAPGEGTAA